MQTVAALPFVEGAFINDGPGADAIRELRPDIIVIGNDWLENEYLNQINLTRNDLNYLNVSVVFIPRIRKISTSEILGV